MDRFRVAVKGDWTRRGPGGSRRSTSGLAIAGHGGPGRDKTLLRATRDVLVELLKRGQDATSRGRDADAARDAILPAIADLMVRITGNDRGRNDAFKTQLVDWYLHRV